MAPARSAEVLLEGAHRADQAEEFELELGAPDVVLGVVEGAHEPLAGVGDQDVGAALPVVHGAGEGLDLAGVEDVAGPGHDGVAEFFRERRECALQPPAVAPAEGDLRAVGEQELHRREPDPRRAPRDDGDAPFEA
jgi:hypothetical protein